MKQVGKLVFKCFCVLLPFFVLGLYMRQHPLTFLDNEAPHYIWNRQKTNTEQEKEYRVIILGDSVANAAYVPEILSQDTLNLALGGTTPVESYYILRDWLDHNPAPEVCYISFQDNHLLLENCFWSRTMYSHRFNVRQTLEMMQAAISHGESSVLTEHYWLDYISYTLYLPNKYITAFMNAGFNQRYTDNSASIQSDELHGGRYTARGTKEYADTTPLPFDQFHVNPLFDEYYYKIAGLCAENGIILRVVKLPLPDNRTFSDDYKKEFYEYYNNLQQQYPFVTVDWFSAYPRDRFADADHMNSHGALQFSTELKERYSEDFISSASDAERLPAIDDSIKAENKIEWILKWITGKDYTVLFYDKRGLFSSMYEEQLKEKWGTETLGLYPVPIDRPAILSDGKPAESDSLGTVPSVWGLSGTGQTVSPVLISLTEEGLTIQFSEQEPQPWVTGSNDILGVTVIRNDNRSIVCKKSFRYVDEAFALVQ